jgi:GNAT superfamily N-acetyltransferase
MREFPAPSRWGSTRGCRRPSSCPWSALGSRTDRDGAEGRDFRTGPSMVSPARAAAPGWNGRADGLRPQQGASLFELDRIHYGQSPAPAATWAWVGEMARSGELEFYGAYHSPRMVGFAVIHQVPASLTLSRFWQLRVLFADPAVRRQGSARQLGETIKQAASDAAALRLSLQTEPDNAAALALYRRCGFTINADLATLSLNIARWRSAFGDGASSPRTWLLRLTRAVIRSARGTLAAFSERAASDRSG